MKAIVLLSGGLDSAVVLAMAKEKNRDCIALSFDYGQRHKVELKFAKKLAAYYGVPNKIITIDPKIFGQSSLVSSHSIPKDRTKSEINNSGIPNTYVPARNTLFLAYAVSQAELENAEEIYAGPTLTDRNAYPDCRPEFYQAFQNVINIATKQAIESIAPTLCIPLIQMDKKAIVKEGKRLKVPFDITFSCYDPSPNEEPCQRCDACTLRLDALSTISNFPLYL